ncbi:PAM68 family protein [Merismopedia glauca]|uniref:DUF3464 domain-containing protein n=1 Tax=Merismopedia glauca CCAP 1448/3 TaxID=1296344 RepID=A0A2T1C6R6_9CYAN|nr:PAM68 family protein [Merismopedia glauca]PSB03858.1 DUF3464 domain-containing protein [Merismopedia glauca CCAP 1448/3]
MSSPPKSQKTPPKASASARGKGGVPFVPGSQKEPSPPKAKSKRDRENPPSPGIPKVVSDRMVKRVAFFSGVPTILGMLTFIVSYVIVKQELFKLPNTAVVLVSMGFFGLGVLGLSYGALSASWDEESPGSVLGWQEFALNFGRLRSAGRSKT